VRTILDENVNANNHRYDHDHFGGFATKLKPAEKPPVK
jgi:hypothetical protein